MSDPERSRRRRRSASGGWSTVATPMAQFIVAGVGALVIVALALSVASRRVGEREGIVDARSESLVKANALVAPALSDGLLDGDEDAIAVLDEVVRDQVLTDSLVRVRVWSTDGTVLYSNVPQLIGSQYDLGEEELETIEAGLVDAEVSDLSKPENRFESEFDKLLEVYLPLRLPNGELVLFEAYFRYDAVEANGTRIWRSLAPITIGALIVLELVQIPLAYSLARRLRQRQLEREVLLSRAIAASEHERRRIAQDLHDGVVQDLAGVSYSLAAMGRAEEQPSPEALEAAAGTVRAGIESLRTLLVELYPPNLSDEGLGPAVADLLARVRASGIETNLTTTALAPEVPLAVAQLIYRTIQESLRNVITHAQATSVEVVIATDEDRTWAEVVDDGVGFDVARRSAEAADGHVGLLGLRDLTTEAGGLLEITSTPGAGTTVRIEVPHP